MLYKLILFSRDGSALGFLAAAAYFVVRNVTTEYDIDSPLEVFTIIFKAGTMWASITVLTVFIGLTFPKFYRLVFNSNA